MNIDWKPRYYYIMQNKTSGKKYVGQTTQDISKYRGSGPYWTNHCKKHGGYTRENIELLEYQWFEKEEDAKKWLEYIEEHNGNYWKLVEWANQVPENTLDNPFYGNKSYLFREKYGVDNPSQIPEVAKKIGKTGKETCHKKYGVSNVSQIPEVIEKQKAIKSSLEWKLTIGIKKIEKYKNTMNIVSDNGLTKNQQRALKTAKTKIKNGSTTRGNNPFAKSIEVNSKKYDCTRDAIDSLGVSYYTINKYIKDPYSVSKKKREKIENGSSNK
jgi:hypothetical protein